MQFFYPDRQRREVCELRRCLQLVTEHAQALEGAVRSAGNGAAPLAGGLVRQAGALQSSMIQCVANATRIRDLLADRHQPHMDKLLDKMVCMLTFIFVFNQVQVFYPFTPKKVNK